MPSEMFTARDVSMCPARSGFRRTFDCGAFSMLAVTIERTDAMPRIEPSSVLRGVAVSTDSVPYHRPIAVVDELVTTVAIWHVDIGNPVLPRMSRLVGAWVLGNNRTEIATLLDERHILRCAPEPENSVLEAIPIAGWIDLDGTVDAVRAEIHDLDKRFTEHAATLKNKLIRPDWPDVPDPGAAPLRSATGPGESQLEGARALALARGIRNLADAWAQVESQRTMRAFLVEPMGNVARPLPLVTR